MFDLLLFLLQLQLETFDLLPSVVALLLRNVQFLIETANLLLVLLAFTFQKLLVLQCNLDLFLLEIIGALLGVAKSTQK